jgi:hypothetical protein
MNSKTGLALSVIGIAAVLMLVLAPITANQTFGYVRYGKHMVYAYHGFHKRVCVVKYVRGPHGGFRHVVSYRR